MTMDYQTSQECLSARRYSLTNDKGAVLLTVVMIIMIIGLSGVAIYSLTRTSAFTQLNAQNASKAFYLAESGFRVVASEYNNATGTKNSILENLHGTTLSLPDNAGQFDVRLYPYWFYVSSAYTADTNSINLKIPGGTPLENPSDAGSQRISFHGSGLLKLQGKTRLATISSLNPNSPVDGATITVGIDPGFPYDIQTDEELFLVYADNTTTFQTIPQGGSIDLPGQNPIAKILPAHNGSFRVYNEINDKMDYTYLERTPPIIDPGNPPTTITLTGIQHQDEGKPSVFPFTVDSASEIYFGRNLAVFSTSTVGNGSMAAKKIIGNYTDVGLDGGFSIGKETISFEEDIADFSPTMGKTGGILGPGDPEPIIVDTANNQIELGQDLPDHYGSVWYKGDSDIANCIEGECFLGRGIRAYFEFQFDGTDSSVDSTDFGDGFSFSLVSGDNYTDGDTGAGGEYMGYAGAGLSSDGLQPPKLAVEIDTYPNTGAGNVCGGDSRRDSEDPDVANHAALVYWGEEAIGSFDAQSTSNFMADGGGYLSLGTSDWRSPQGTISFWFKRDTIRYSATTASGDRMWGQSGNMEMRFVGSSGNDLALDWGGNTLTITNHPYTVAGKWYFMAIVWDESLDDLIVYYGDETTTPYRYAFNLGGWSGVLADTPVVENLFLNSSGGNGSQNYIIDGNGSDLRYYNITRGQLEIQNDYNLRLAGDETGLQAYFPLQADLKDAGPSNISATAMGTTAWSPDTPSPFDCGTGAASYDDNRHGSGGLTTPQNALNSNTAHGNDGYHQLTKVPVDPNWLEDNTLHSLRLELIRPLSLASDGKIDTVYDYQVKVWIDCETCSPAELLQFKDVKADFSASQPLIEKSILKLNSLEIDADDHDDLKRFLFGFTQGTGGAIQNIVLSNFQLYFLRQYPVSDLADWGSGPP
jgi:hypothetical protein